MCVCVVCMCVFVVVRTSISLLQIRFAVQRRRKRHVIQGSRHGVDALVGGHALYTVFRLVRRQLSSQLVRQNVRLEHETQTSERRWSKKYDLSRSSGRYERQRPFVRRSGAFPRRHEDRVVPSEVRAGQCC